LPAFPGGIILLLPLAWALFFNKGKFLAVCFNLSCRGLLSYLFFVLLGSFFNFAIGQAYFNIGGIIILILGGRLFYYSTAWRRLRIGMAVLAVGVFSYGFEVGIFWWLITWPLLITIMLLPLVSVLLALALAGSLRQAWASLIFGLLLGQAAASWTISRGIYFEVGNFAVLNGLFITLAGAVAADWLKRRLLLRLKLPQPVKRTL
jgi:hypothetical protein